MTAMTMGSMSSALLSRNAVRGRARDPKSKPSSEVIALETGNSQGRQGDAPVIEKNQTVLNSTESMVRWTLKRKLVANALSSATQFLLLAHTPVSRKVFQVSVCNVVRSHFWSDMCSLILHLSTSSESTFTAATSMECLLSEQIMG